MFNLDENVWKYVEKLLFYVLWIICNIVFESSNIYGICEFFYLLLKRKFIFGIFFFILIMRDC